ncbi:MAG: adenylyltransferase/cytidyltransferase family protein [Chthonomonadaceae bacterium]|nr:adenylyltransferase/cytidyltransferase family protein [Chthonomonadaceae bacterium]
MEAAHRQAEGGTSMIRGMLLGKFMPPHRGHEYLLRFAQSLVDELTVQVCTSVREPLPGHLRCKWMRDHFGGIRVVHNDDENPFALHGTWERRQAQAHKTVERLLRG